MHYARGMPHHMVRMRRWQRCWQDGSAPFTKIESLQSKIDRLRNMLSPTPVVIVQSAISVRSLTSVPFGFGASLPPPPLLPPTRCGSTWCAGRGPAAVAAELFGATPTHDTANKSESVCIVHTAHEAWPGVGCSKRPNL